ncbi:hypothetical protein DFJ73DRAFT_859053 [Zopfochytrium polystomum]|nr:hypothetical protein DFJ73DRAFT_859053 [Zopfochytrium polystomum]
MRRRLDLVLVTAVAAIIAAFSSDWVPRARSQAAAPFLSTDVAHPSSSTSPQGLLVLASAESAASATTSTTGASTSAVVTVPTQTSSSTSVSPTPTGQANIKAVVCGPASVDDFGVLVFNSTNLLVTADQYGPTLVSYQATNSPDGQIVPQMFTQDDVNNNRVTYTPAVGLTVIGSTKSTVATFIISDPFGDTTTCTMSITIGYRYAPILDALATPTIATVQYQPVVIDTSIVNVLEQHGLSTWYLNWTSVGQTFNSGGQGRIEYYTTDMGWIPLPLTQPFPHEWIVQKSIRYNPTSYVGTTYMVLRLVNNLGISMTKAPTANVTITVASSSTKTLGTTAVPPYANLGCVDMYPKPFVNSYQTTVGPFCTTFMTTANQATKFTTPFLGASLTVTTTVAANVSLSFAIQPSAASIPAGFTPLTFAGYMDYGAFAISMTPSTALSTVVFASPEMTFDLAMQITSTTQVTAVQFTPGSTTTSASYINSVATSGPPRLTMNLYQAGYYVLCQGSSSASTATGTASVQYGPTVFIGAWTKKSFLYPATSGMGQLQVTVYASADFTFTVVQGGSTIWSPPGMVRLDYFTVSCQQSGLTYNLTLTYTFAGGALSSLGYDIKNVKVGRFASTIDGGDWKYDQPYQVDTQALTAEVSINNTMLGQWALFVPATSGAACRAPFQSSTLVAAALASVLVIMLS